MRGRLAIQPDRGIGGVLQVDLRIGIAGGERVRPGQAEVPRAAAAPRLLLLALDDGEGRVDVAYVVAAGDGGGNERERGRREEDGIRPYRGMK